MTLFGNRIGSGTVIESFPKQYARSGAGIDYPVEAHENAVHAARPSTLGSYHLAVHRGYYLFLNETWPPNNSTQRAQRDATAGRMIFMSHKPASGITWAQVAAGTSDAQIDARGAELATFFAANPGYSMAWTGPHEPNGNEATASISGTTVAATGINNWWRAVERIIERWKLQGVPMWVGTQLGVTTTAGLIVCGPNLAGAAGITLPAEYDTWYKTTVTEPWGWDNIQMASFDMYQGGSSGDAMWRAFDEMAGATTVRPGFLSWSDPKVVSQNAAGKVLLRAIWEFACDNYDKIWPSPPQRMFTANSAHWNSLGIPNTQTAWFQHAGAWLNANPDVFYAACFWDSCATTGSPAVPTGRGPHMVDMTSPDWQGYLDFLEDIEAELSTTDITVTRRATSYHSTANLATTPMTDGGFPPAGMLLIWVITNRGNTSFATTKSAYGLSWTTVGQFGWSVAAGIGSKGIYATFSDGATSAVPSATFAASEGRHMTMYQVSGVDTTGAVLDCIRDQGGGIYIVSGSGTGTSLTLSLDTFSNPGSRGFSSFEHAVVEGTSPRAGGLFLDQWTELDDANFATPASASQDQWLSATNVTPAASASWFTSSPHAGVALELLNAAQEVTVGLINQTAVVFAPQVVQPAAQTVTAPLIDNSAVLFIPKMRKHVDTTLIDNSAVTFAPTVSANSQTVITGLIDQSAVTFAPSTSSSFTVGLIDQSASVFAPTVINSARGIGSLGSRSALRRGHLRGSPDLIRGPMRMRGMDGSSTLRFAYRLRGNDQPAKATMQVTPGLIDQSAVTFAPSVNASAITMPLISQVAVVFSPQLNQAVVVGLLDNSAETFAPVVSTALELTPDIIDNSAVTFAPSVNPQAVETPLINQSAVAFTLDVNHHVQFDIIDNSATTFEPIVGAIVLPLIDQSAVTFAPDLSPVLPALIDQSATTFAPLIVIPFPQAVRFDDDIAFFLDNSAVTFSPEVQLAPPQTVTAPLIDNSAVVFAPRMFVPTRTTILKRARYSPEFTLAAKYTPEITKRAKLSRQG